MSVSTVRLLSAAAEIVGGREALAEHLGIGERMLAKFMADLRPLPDPLLLKVVDIILAYRGASPGVERSGLSVSRARAANR